MVPIALSSPATGPPRVVGPATKTATRPADALPQWLVDSSQIDDREPFDAKKHLSFQSPSRIYTMKEIGLEGQGISPHAVSEPFSLFTEEAVRQMRAEIFSPDVLDHCRFASTFNQNMIRGMGPVRAPFTYDAWNSPELLAKISQVAGLDLVPVFDHDIANINISVGGGGDQLTPPRNEPLDDDLSSVAWHYDSFPFVCVTMISNCEGMVGGETALRTGTGEVMKVRGPAMGTAVVMQGRYIEHQALKALGGRERISMVTAFRPKSPFVKDESILTGVRGISVLSDLYSQYTEYRLDILEERVRARQKFERQRQVAKRQFDTADMRDWLTEQKEFIEAMLTELHEP
ncbi:hypothetical protein P170DRAFT_451649 [Aspergillus steynii IBT 23096]|uniref:Fe2OG dioxygenase domain-containing protein n=1 Tax=Aspergillus steynii IBT 23096 TaxID=1392250 RepID=A0A2I2GL48_9EURO|nr:uncharacterized protein P170DRAFT_451649 [Aspergillus steynii IBT 23096]PLB53591.1 hypothetical protein P170DRAFT_451649 [Aspergillus steynii IBT 23096]